MAVALDLRGGAIVLLQKSTPFGLEVGDFGPAGVEGATCAECSCAPLGVLLGSCNPPTDAATHAETASPATITAGIVRREITRRLCPQATGYSFRSMSRLLLKDRLANTNAPFVEPDCLSARKDAKPVRIGFAVSRQAWAAWRMPSASGLD